MAITPNYEITGIGEVRGTWTHTTGTAAETYTLTGKPVEVYFEHNDSTGKYGEVKTSETTSGNQTTITVNYNGTVTAGRFKIKYIPY